MHAILTLLIFFLFFFAAILRIVFITIPPNKGNVLFNATEFHWHLVIVNYKQYLNQVWLCSLINFSYETIQKLF